MNPKHFLKTAAGVALALTTSVATVFADEQPKAFLKTEHFDRDPGWESRNNRTVPASVDAVTQNFGWSNTKFASKTAGEIGGTLWRASHPAWYAEKISPKTFDDKLSASGTFAITDKGSSAVILGWFKSGTGNAAPDQAGSLLGVRVAGPSRVGHYFAPSFTTAKGTARTAGKGPVLIPGRAYDWTMTHDPLTNGSLGSIRVTLDGEAFTFDLKRGDRAQGGQFDRFGLFSIHNDGGHAPVKIWFDDLKYSASPVVP